MVEVFTQMSNKAAALMDGCRDEFLPGVVERFGLLTDIVQVKAAIALQHITRNGIVVDALALAQLTDRVAAEIATLVDAIVHMDGFSVCSSFFTFPLLPLFFPPPPPPLPHTLLPLPLFCFFLLPIDADLSSSECLPTIA